MGGYCPIRGCESGLDEVCAVQTENMGRSVCIFWRESKMELFMSLMWIVREEES